MSNWQQAMHLLFTPGIYDLTEPIRSVMRPDTVV